MSTDRLDELILQWSQDVLSENDAAELNAELQSNAEARHRLHRHTSLDAALRARSSPPSAAWIPPVPVKTTKKKAPILLMAMAAGFAALLCAAAFIIGGRQARTLLSPEETNVGCAILTRTVDAAWSGTGARSGDTLNAGILHLDKGLAQIEFFSGATLLLEGSAELEIISPWEAICRSGKARVHVPQPAHGFKLLAPGMKLIDLGTEFGLNVQADGRSEVQVFEGEVEAHPDSGPQLNLKEGQGAQQQAGRLTQTAGVRSRDFVDMARIEELGSAHDHQRFTEWQAWSRHTPNDPRLIAYYPFTHFRQAKWDRLVDNAAAPADKSRAGGAVGAAWTEGRWPEKDAIEFKRPGDRLRMNIDGIYSALTLACWVRIDGLDRRYNALLLTDGYDPGKPHWQVYEDGRLMFSIMYRDSQGTNRNQIYFSPMIFNRSNTGRWHHVAVTYNNQSGRAVQYVDGREVSSEISPLHQPGRPITFGPCEIGNWGLPTTGHKFPIRNLNGSIDEFSLYKAALNGDEIRAAYAAGKPE
ncbi:MAG: putative transrane anti-sigma factor [Verrucomicrobiaceae bacterium]|nr:putative transrane anti-sigma factor [Verrucomicrobiaceae bacterium]